MERRQKAVQSFAIGAVLAAVFAVAVTIAAELMPPLKTWLADTFTHHWIGKSVLAAAIYVGTSIIIFAVPSAGSQEQARKSLAALFWISWVVVAAIIGFFLYEAFWAY